MIEKTVKLLLSDQLGTDVKDIKNSDNIIHDLGADSLDLVELLLAIEEKFNINISESEADNNSTVEQLIDIIDKKING